MQAVAGPNLWIAPWDDEQENTQFPVLKLPSDLPDGSNYDDRYTLAIYTGSYLNLKQEGSRIWAQLRLVHVEALKIDLSKLGDALLHAFSDLPFEVRFGRQPLHCQATKTACLGWLYGSTKSISEDTFLPAIRQALNIPTTVALGIQWRAISDKFGKRPPFDRDNPSPSAIHVDIDSRHAPTYQRAASNLWRHYDRQKDRPKLPNDIQLRLVPCFSSAQCRSLTATATANITLMSSKQQFFITERIERLEVPFILLLDTPLSADNDITLRRAIMSRSPKNDPSKRLIHNIDFGWQDSRRAYATTVKPLLSEAYDFIASLIPEMVYRYGPSCQKWFSAEGLTTFESVTWDPEKMISVSAADNETQILVDEDLWGLGEDWRTDVTKKDILQEPTNELINQVTTRTLEDADDVHSFASTFGNKRPPKPLPADTGKTKQGGRVTLSTDVIDILNSKPSHDKTDTCSMSTAAFTTESTRVKLKDARAQINHQRDELTQQAVELEELRLELEQLRKSTSHLKVNAGPFEHTIVFDHNDPEFYTAMEIHSPNRSVDYTEHDVSPSLKANLRKKFSHAKDPLPSQRPSSSDFSHDEETDNSGSSDGHRSSNSLAHSHSVGSPAVVDLVDDGGCDC